MREEDPIDRYPDALDESLVNALLARHSPLIGELSKAELAKIGHVVLARMKAYREGRTWPDSPYDEGGEDEASQ